MSVGFMFCDDTSDLEAIKELKKKPRLKDTEIAVAKSVSRFIPQEFSVNV
tara:strand:+ start:202895 stop:203044 length:150 start_codon:yes stop_codon:yes gene_type:complete